MPRYANRQSGHPEKVVNSLRIRLPLSALRNKVARKFYVPNKVARKSLSMYANWKSTYIECVRVGSSTLPVGTIYREMAEWFKAPSRKGGDAS